MLYRNITPMIYPDGEIVWLVVAAAAVFGGAVNVISNWKNIDNFWEGLAYFGSGAVNGGLSVFGPAGRIAGSFLSSAINVKIEGGSWGDAFKNGAIASIGAIVGAKVGNWAAKAPLPHDCIVW